MAATKGAWYRSWRLVSRDGSTLDIADKKGNEAAFGRLGASRGKSAYPQIRFVSLVDNGTHVLFGSRMADYATSEIALAKTILPSLSKGMLCLADRSFFGFELGAVFTQTTWDQEGNAIRDPDSTTYTAAIETAEEFGNRIYAEAWKRGWSRAGKKVVIGEGAGWIWNMDLEYCGAAFPRCDSDCRSLSRPPAPVGPRPQTIPEPGRRAETLDDHSPGFAG